MTIAIMQPYFLPYIGYFQLISAVDTFIVYDNIQYTKKGWINRNRLLCDGSDILFSIPLKKDSDYKDVKDRHLADDFVKSKQKLVNQIKAQYMKAPYFTERMDLINDILNFENHNLFEYILNSITKICKCLDIKTEIVISSTISIDHNLKGSDKVIAICQSMKTERYINSIGGESLYSKEEFIKKGIQLEFLSTNVEEYEQFGKEFVPNLSIIDVLMFNSIGTVQKMLTEYRLS